mgnify:FL=1
MTPTIRIHRLLTDLYTGFPQAETGLIGAPGKIRTCDLSLHTTTAFAADDVPFVVWTLSSPLGYRPLGAARQVSTPSHPVWAWLGIATTGCAEVSPSLSRFTQGVSDPGAQV